MVTRAKTAIPSFTTVKATYDVNIDNEVYQFDASNFEAIGRIKELGVLATQIKDSETDWDSVKPLIEKVNTEADELLPLFYGKEGAQRLLEHNTSAFAKLNVLMITIQLSNMYADQYIDGLTDVANKLTVD